MYGSTSPLVCGLAWMQATRQKRHEQLIPGVLVLTRVFPCTTRWAVILFTYCTSFCLVRSGLASRAREVFCGLDTADRVVSLSVSTRSHLPAMRSLPPEPRLIPSSRWQQPPRRWTDCLVQNNLRATQTHAPPERRCVSPPHPRSQTARALVWSGKDPSKLGESATYVDRHRSAVTAVSEAARRTELLMGTLTTADGKGAREKAAVQRQWLSVLDRHEAWMRRRWVGG